LSANSSSFDVGRALTILNATSATAPSASTDGVANTFLEGGTNTGPRVVELTIDGSTNITFSGVQLCGWDGSKWRIIRDVRDGKDVTLTATLGYAERLVDIGGFTRFALVGTISAGTVTAKLVPIGVS
jgi:hypothetical protein